jgi:hypothetical protein
MNARSLKSDELGEKGEARFREICANDSLICNKADRDRAGWDFIVDFPFPSSTGSLTLDQRPIPMSCRVQIKTIWATNKRVKLHLSSAERLAKELKPAFIFVFTVDINLEVEEAFILHMRGDNLARVLERLRKAELEENARLNQSWISFDPRGAGVPVPLKMGGLRRQILAETGDDLKAYTDMKAQQLATLGYNNARFKLKTTFQTGSYDELVEAFLGLRPIEATKVERWETRFEVTVPMEALDSNEGRIEIRIDPQPSDKCEVIAYDESGGSPARFSGDLLLPAVPLKAEQLQAVVRTSLFTLHLKSQVATLQFLQAPLSNSRFTIEVWRNWFRLLIGMSDGRLRVEIVPSRQEETISLTLEGSPNPDSADWARAMLAILDKAETLLSSAGSDAKPVTLDELNDSAPGIENAFEFRHPTDEPGLLSFVSDGPTAPIGTIELVHANAAWVMGRLLAFGGLVEMRAIQDGQIVKWESVRLKSAEVRDVSGGAARYRAFIRDMKKRTGVENEVVKQIDSFAFGQGTI